MFTSRSSELIQHPPTDSRAPQPSTPLSLGQPSGGNVSPRSSLLGQRPAESAAALPAPQHPPQRSARPVAQKISQQALRTAIAHPSASSLLKRAIDIAGAAVGLLLTLCILPWIAIAIRRDSPGPIFYSQIRCGLNGKPFRIWKFRSMVVDADRLQHLVNNQAKGNIFKNECDPRITRSGRFLRKTSLDEFPQFWNVLKGDMSLVGTRPPTVSEVMQYRPHHWKRLQVKPGITGEWQVNGRSAISDFEEIVALDLDYQRKWSVTYDILLIIRTVGVVFNRRGAY